MKHTSAPWEMKPEEVDKSYIRIRGTHLGGRFKIANVFTPVYDGVPEREAEETRANAQLIAAAPELLEALLRVMSVFHCPTIDSTSEEYREWYEITDDARAAIKKALGE